MRNVAKKYVHKREQAAINGRTAFSAPNGVVLWRRLELVGVASGADSVLLSSPHCRSFLVSRG